MIFLQRAMLAGTAILTIAVTAVAATPTMLPTRDVDVLYLAARPDDPRGMPERIRWSGSRQRIDLPAQGLYVILDRQRRVMSTVRDANRTVVSIDAHEVGAFGTLGKPPEQFEAAGSATIQGLSCTLWKVGDPRSARATLCLTEDGVMLRAEAAGVVLAEAQRVTFGPIDESIFLVPSDYRVVKAPGADTGGKPD